MLKQKNGTYDVPQVELCRIEDNGLFCTSNVNDMDYVSGSWVTEEE